MTLKTKALENTVGKEENAGKQHFLLFPQCFQLLSQREIVILAVINLSSANAFKVFMSKNLLFGKGLTLSQMINFTLFHTQRVCRRQFEI